MPRVKIKIFATLKERYGRGEVEVDCDGSLRDAVEKAAEILGSDFVAEVFDGSRPRDDRIILVNGRHIQFLEKIELRDGDVIAIFPPLAGG